jgi:predicted negative regulator of RcsB-dependent stress response
MKLGQRWDSDPRLRTWFHRFDAVILAVILIGIVLFVWTRWQGRIRAGDAVGNRGL